MMVDNKAFGIKQKRAKKGTESRAAAHYTCLNPKRSAKAPPAKLATAAQVATIVKFKLAACGSRLNFSIK